MMSIDESYGLSDPLDLDEDRDEEFYQYVMKCREERKEKE